MYKYVFYNELLESDYTDITPKSDIEEIRIGIGADFSHVETRIGIAERSKEYLEQVDNFSFLSASVTYKF